MSKEYYIGCHLSVSGGFEAMGKDALSIGANTFAFFTRNPRGGKAKAIDSDDALRLRELMAQNGFGKLVAHAPYTLNPCSAKPEVREFAYSCMSDDMERMEYIPGNYYNFHPGSHVGQGAETGIELTSALLNKVLSKDQSTIVLLETMAGKGSELGRSFEELRAIIDRVEVKEKIGVCLDTCHISDGGYDIKNRLEDVLDEFDRIVGLDKLYALHINDSMNPTGSHKDRHARIGEGTLGLDTIVAVISNPRLAGLPCILETPNDKISGYGEEIAMIREALEKLEGQD